MSIHSAVSTALLIVLLIADSILSAQSKTPGTTFASKAELVEIPVVVTSRSGTPIRGLGREDFVVESDHRSQTIAVFHEVEASAPSKACASTSNITSNRPPTSGETLIVVIDVLNTRKMTKLRDSSVTVLKELMANQTPVSVLAIGKEGLVQLHPVCASNEQLRSVITALTSEEPDATSDTGSAAHLQPAAERLIRDLRNKHVPAHNFELVRRIDFRETTFLAVEEILRAFAPISNRKKLIWLGQDLPAYLQPLEVTDGNDLFEYKNTFSLVSKDKSSEDNSERSERFERWRRRLLLWKRLNDANFRVMPILDEVPIAEPSGGIPGVFGVAMPGLTASSLCDTVNNYSYDPHLAERIPDVCYNDAEGCLRRALADRHYYTIGFYLKHEVKPGVHRLDVRVTERLARVYSRQGFLVPGDKLRHPTGTPAPSNNSYDAPQFTSSIFSWTFLTSPLDSADIPLSVEWSRTQDDIGAISISYKLSAAPNEISIDPNDLSMKLHIATYTQAPGDESSDLQEQAFVRFVTPEQQQQLVTKGFVYEGRLQPKGGTTAIRFLLHDDNTGRVGTVTAMLD